MSSLQSLKFVVVLLSTATVCLGQLIDVDYMDFSDTSGLQINGDAVSRYNGIDTNPVLSLTPLVFPVNRYYGGSAFSLTQINASEFSTKFAFRITDPGGITDGFETGADGLAFVVQNVSNTVGGLGGGLGYAGLPQSVAVEYDTFYNAGSDPGTNHIGIAVNGNVDTVVDQNVSPRFDDGNVWTTWIDYDGTTLEVRANQSGVRPTSALLSLDLDIASILGQSDAYIGFTAATGGAWGNHDIVSWQYSSRFIEGGIDEIPEPAAIGFFSLAGLSALLVWRKRREAA